MKRIILALVAISIVSLFTGCGQSGPLYLPGNPSKIQPPPAPPEEAEEEDEEEEDSGAGGG